MTSLDNKIFLDDLHLACILNIVEYMHKKYDLGEMHMDA